MVTPLSSMWSGEAATFLLSFLLLLLSTDDLL